MKDLLLRYPILDECKEAIASAADAMEEVCRLGGKFLLCGNGGSCADCGHIVGELMKGFLSPRILSDSYAQKIRSAFPDQADEMIRHLQMGLPAISLPDQAAISSAFINDVSAEMVYAQLVLVYQQKNDMVIGLSTSGNSVNVVNAMKIAKSFGLKTLALTGKNACAMDSVCDIVIHVPEIETYKVQELHLPVYHYLCAETERRLFT